MQFKALGSKENPAVLFFHAMGVTGASSEQNIKPYFVTAGKALTYGSLRRQMADSLEDKPFPPLPQDMQSRMYFEFGSSEEHYKYRSAVMEAYPCANFPVFEGYNHMQHQIRDPEGFAAMLRSIVEENRLPALPFLRK